MKSNVKRFAILLCLLCVSLSNVQAKLPIAVEGEKLPSLAPMLQNVQPAVVNISTVTNVRVRQYHPFFDDPFFRQFYGTPSPQNQREQVRKKQGLGSGVIVNAEKGLIITNAHVIEGVDEISVTLKNGREYQAKIVGSDKETDVAVIQVSAQGLSEMKLGNSDNLLVGDFVVAIGNPFGLRQTVTSGIVSGLGRSGLGIEGYEDFIQTDASINPGNSGGALVNLRGELVGINTAIIAPSGGSVGINFAIPVNMVMQLKEQLVEFGEIKRGQLGVELQDLTPALADAMAVNVTQGAVISAVQNGSPAEKAGLRGGDIVLYCNNREIRNASDFRNIYGLTRAGERLSMRVLRDDQTINLVAKLDESITLNSGSILHPRLQGATFEDMPNEKGILVSKVELGTAANTSGLRAGDIIHAANRQKVGDIESLKKALSKKKGLMLNIIRGSSSLFILLQ